MTARAFFLSLLVLTTATSVLAVDGPTDETFLFDFATIPPTLSNDDGTVTLVNTGNTDDLIGTGASFASVTLAPGGILSPHSHPRATEVLRVLRGTFRSCLVQELGGGRFCNDLTEGQIMVFPEDTLHYQQNIGDVEAEFYSVLNNENPGAFFYPATLFQLPSEALSAMFNLRISRINVIRDGLAGIPTDSGPNERSPANTLERALSRSGF